ncbi:hypothetical protein TNCV_4926391 [Trichonephila clavipes]|nr:hypothetical protein TNCV_4926391 [Trichonephila clavipes]
MGKDSSDQGFAGVVQGGHASTLRLTADGCMCEDRFHKKEADHRCETLRYSKDSPSFIAVAQQHMRARASWAPSIGDHWALRCMSRCTDKVVSLKRDPEC